jgi:phosphoglycerate dehydrogenase-like enzyme
MTRIGICIPTGLAGTLFAPSDRARLAQLPGVDEVRWWTSAQAPTADEAVEHLNGCAIGLGSWGTPHPGSALLSGAEVITRCPELRLWEHVAGTVKSFFTDAVRSSDLIIASCKGAIADTVAEYVIGAMISGLRQAPANAAAMRQGPAGKPPGLRVLAGATVTVIGASEVGRRVIAHLRPFACRILLCDPFISAAEAAALGSELCESVERACAQSVVVTLHTPLLESTRGLVDARALAALPDGALFINTSRGECVDEAALIGELQRGRVNAWLDVTAPEPAAIDSPLRRLPNVVLTAHIAGPACAWLGQRAVDDIAAFLRGESPQCVVTTDMLARIA